MATHRTSSSNEIKKRSGQAVSYEGTDVFKTPGSTGPNAGTWKSFVVLAATTISALTDDGGIPSTGLTGASLPAGTFASANGDFISITLTSGTISMSRSQ